MRRRSFIGGGMAAILASRRAPAFCLALRNGMVRQSAPPTPPLPYDAEVEYLQSDGTAYINTGIPLFGVAFNSVDFIAETDVSVQDDGSVLQTEGMVFCFGPSLTQRAGLSLITNSGGVVMSGFLYGASAVAQLENVPDGEFVHVVIDYKSSAGTIICSVDGTVKYQDTSFSNTATIGNCNLLAFARVRMASTATSPTINVSNLSRIRTFKFISQMGSCDLRAVRKDGVGLMYDSISGQLLGNAAGTGALTIGPDKS